MANSIETPKAQEDLPSVDDFPNADVVIYDGECRFCTKQVRRLHRWDGHNRLAFISLHDSRVTDRYPDLSHDELMDQMYVIDRQGRRYGGATAFRYLTRRLPKLWILAPLTHLPFSLPLWRWCYRQVAKRRYKIAGKTDCDSGTCDIHFE